jgi:hypothetical protein
VTCASSLNVLQLNNRAAIAASMHTPKLRHVLMLGPYEKQEARNVLSVVRVKGLE